MTRVLVAAQSPVVRAGLETLLASSPALTVVGGASAGGLHTVAERVDEHQPDVVLVELGRGDAAEDALAALSPPGAGEGAAGPAPVVLGAPGADAAFAADALRAGARGVLPAGATGAEIVAAVEAAAAGVVVVHPELVGALVGPVATAGGARPRAAARADAAPVQPLTPRELEVLALLAAGLANKQIAARLGISEHTVKFHVASVFEKLGAGTRAEAVAIGVRTGAVML